MHDKGRLSLQRWWYTRPVVEQVGCFSTSMYPNAWIQRGAERRGWEGRLLRHNYDLRNVVCSLRHVKSASEGVGFQKF